MKKQEIENKIKSIKGKTIAIVYIFEGDKESGFEHFFVWKGNIISLWLNAIYNIKCLPLLLDVRTFVDKAINGTLPHIDFVINLNSGTNDLSAMGLIPSVCSSIDIPCIPCNTNAIITGENKKTSNHIARSIGLKVPNDLNKDVEGGIFRPINLGNSMGVKRKFDNNNDGIYQEFIYGYDITTPLVFNPITKKIDVLPTILYIPNSHDNSWFNGEQEKLSRSGYSMKCIQLASNLKRKYVELSKEIMTNTFCRIDSRISSSINPLDIHTVSINETYFVEINVMPTIREFNNFVFSFNSISESSDFSIIKELQKKIFDCSDLHTFLLINSILSLEPCTE